MYIDTEKLHKNQLVNAFVMVAEKESVEEEIF